MRKNAQARPLPTAENNITLRNLIEHFGFVISQDNPEKKAEALRKLKELLTSFAPQVADLKFGTNQEDSSEFLLPLLDALYGEEKPFIEKSEIVPSEKTQQNLKSKPEKSTSNSLIALEIQTEDVGSSICITDLITNYTKEETLETEVKFVPGTGEEESTENGTFPAKAKKTLSIAVNPNAKEIFFSFKRFKTTNNGSANSVAISKIGTAIYLDNPLVEDKSSKDVLEFNLTDGNKKKFKPTGFTVHLETAEGRHYITYALEKEGDTEVWFLYDDSKKIKIVQGDETQNFALFQERKSQAYIVKYSAMGEDGKFFIPQSSTQPCGTRNLGNTCWANSAIALVGSSSLATKLEAKKEIPHTSYPQTDTKPETTASSETPENPENPATANPLVPTTPVPAAQEDRFSIDTKEVVSFFANENTKTTAQEKLGSNSLILVKPAEQSLKDNPQFHFTSKATNTKFKELITATLEAARKSESLTEEEAGAIMLIAIKNQGIGSSQKLLDKLKEDLEKIAKKIGINKPTEEMVAAAKKFSKAFQDKAKENGLFTGNKEAKNFVGMRLKRVDPSFAKELLGDKYADIATSLGIPTTPQSSLNAFETQQLINNPISPVYTPSTGLS